MRRDYGREIRDRLTCREVVEHCGFEPNRSGNIKCPFHSGGNERTPSLHIYPDGWNCFACGAHGDCIGFVMQYQNLTFIQAVAYIDRVFHLGILNNDRKQIRTKQERVNRIDMESNRLIDRLEALEEAIDHCQGFIDGLAPDDIMWAYTVRAAGALRCDAQETRDALFDRGIRETCEGWYRIRPPQPPGREEVRRVGRSDERRL